MTRWCANLLRWPAALWLLSVSDCAVGDSGAKVGSLYVKSQLIRAAEGGTVEITAADNRELAGTRISFPPDALARDTVITIAIGRQDLPAAGAVPAGPVVEIGPAGTELLLPAMITLPGRPLPPIALARVFARTAETAPIMVMPQALEVDVAAELATFSSSRLSAFQVCRADTPCTGQVCDAGDVCRNGGCWPACDVESAPFTHIMFIVDRSNSMLVSDPNHGRISAIADVVTRFVADPDTLALQSDVAFAVVGFWGGVATHTQDATGNPGFSEDGTAVFDAISQLATTSANTSYAGALSAAVGLIDQRLATLSPGDAARSTFQLVFITDGLPYPYDCEGEPNSLATAVRWVEVLRNKAVYGGVPLTFHTVFVSVAGMFTAPVPIGDATGQSCCLGVDAPPISLVTSCDQEISIGAVNRKLLQEMAAAGGGTFTTFSETSPASLEDIDFEPPVTTSCPAGWVCEVADGLCAPGVAPGATSCQRDDDCPVASLCRAGACVPNDLGCGESCALDDDDILKVLFLVDDSESMEFSDPDNRRNIAVESAVATLQDAGDLAATGFAVVRFNSGEKVFPPLTGLPGEPRFTNDTSVVQAALSASEANGLSDLQGALQAADAILRADIEGVAAQGVLARTHYAVVLIADGLPEPICAMGADNDVDPATPTQPYRLCESADYIDCLLKRDCGQAGGTTCPGAAGPGTCDHGSETCMNPNPDLPACSSVPPLFGNLFGSELRGGYAYNQPFQLDGQVRSLSRLREQWPVAGIRLHVAFLPVPQEDPFGSAEAARGLLRRLAQTGHGNFLEFSWLGALDLMQLAIRGGPVGCPEKIPHVLCGTPWPDCPVGTYPGYSDIQYTECGPIADWTGACLACE